MKNIKDKIYIADWLTYKPFRVSSPTDTYYLKLANEIYVSLQTTKEAKEYFLDMSTMREIAIISVAYLEDVVSEMGIFNSFRMKHREIYQKNLPFFDDKKDYFDDEINFCDVHFLVWYILNVLDEEIFVDHFSEEVKNISENIYPILDREFEYAPANTAFFKIFDQVKERDLAIFRKFASDFATTNYLYGIDLAFQMDEYTAEVVNQLENVSEEYFFKLRYAATVKKFIKIRSRLLNMSIFEITARVAGKDFKYYSDLISIEAGSHCESSFEIIAVDEQNVHLKHISTGKTIDLVASSHPEKLNSFIGKIIYLGIVKMANQWHFSGMSLIDNNKKDIKQIKEREEMTLFLFDEEMKQQNKKVLNKLYSYFTTFHKNTFAYIEPHKLAEMYVDFYKYQTEKEGLKFDDFRKNILTQQGQALQQQVYEDLDVEDGDLIVYFNPKAGFEFYDNVAKCINVGENPYFENVTSDDIIHFITNDAYSTEFFNEIINDYFEKNILKDIPEYKDYSRADFDFLKRFFSSETYETKSRFKVI